MINPELVQTILETAKIEEVIGEFVTLRRRGVNLLGNCPFHNEKTPSFTVSPTKGIFKCFGCGKSGNVASFLMEHEHFTFPEAIRYLGKKYHIDIEEEEPSAEQLHQQSEREALFHVTEFAQKYFASLLFDSEKGRAIGLSYFKERGLNEEIIKKFGLGYCKEEWDNFTQHALNSGYSMDALVKSGLTIEKDGKHYDRFRGRVIFPIHSISGRILGFSARILSVEKKAAKYVNSPESEIYNKSRTLYGVFFAKSAIVKNDMCYLVEGNIDVVTLQQSGIENVVASSGTSLTEEQIKLIKRYTKNITILYDGDAAGVKASFRAVDMLVQEGLNVRIVLFPDGEDPDSYATKRGSSELIDFIQKSSDNFILFKTKVLKNEIGNDPIAKASLIKEIIQTISLIPNSIDRSVYLKECSSLLDISEQTLTSELSKLLRDKIRKEIQGKEPGLAEKETSAIESEAPFLIERERYVEENNSNAEAQERKIISLLLNYGTKTTIQLVRDESGQRKEESFFVAAFIVGDIMNDELSFDNPFYQEIFDTYKEYLLKEHILQEQYFIQSENPNHRSLAATLLTQTHSVSEKWQSRWQISVPKPDSQERIDLDVKDSLLSFKLKKLDKKIDTLSKKIQSPDSEEELMISLAELQQLKEIRVQIARELKRVVS